MFVNLWLLKTTLDSCPRVSMFFYLVGFSIAVRSSRCSRRDILDKDKVKHFWKRRSITWRKRNVLRCNDLFLTTNKEYCNHRRGSEPGDFWTFWLRLELRLELPILEISQSTLHPRHFDSLIIDQIIRFISCITSSCKIPNKYLNGATE